MELLKHLFFLGKGAQLFYMIPFSDTILPTNTISEHHPCIRNLISILFHNKVLLTTSDVNLMIKSAKATYVLFIPLFNNK